MSWSAPYTYTPLEVHTAAQLNQYERDNMKVGRQRVTNRRTSGNVTLNSTTWTNVDTGLDVTLAATTSDVIEAAVSAVWNSDAVVGVLDASCVASGTHFGRGGAAENGVAAWRGDASVVHCRGGSIDRTLVSGDVSASNTIIRLRGRTLTAANKVLLAVASDELVWMARNHGPHVAP